MNSRRINKQAMYYTWGERGGIHIGYSWESQKERVILMRIGNSERLL
jgi:hypothetical protein